MGKRGKGGQSNRGVSGARPAPAKQANTAVIDKMAVQYNATSYGPSAPLYPYPGLQPQGGPRQWQYPIAGNLNLNPRDNLTPFQVLCSFGDLYDGIRLCKQSWFDCAAGLEPTLVCAPGILGKNEDESKYADEMQVYLDFFESPDKQHTIHEWMNAALDDLCTIDAVAMYPRLTYGGALYSLDLIDGSSIKPLLDDRGRSPEPPFYAYEQVVYGAPSELFTSDELLYLKEHNRTYSEFGFSRVENILMRVNQALRKQSLDMAMFTDGNIPAGFVSPAADLGWTPDQLQAFQTILDSLYSGNDALRSRLKMMPPGSNFTPTNPISVETAFDLFLFTVTCASFGTTPAESGFTDTVNRATGESQADVLYRRTLKPIALRFARLFNYILKKYFNEKRFLFAWKGYEAADDFGTSATAHTALVQAGIESIPEAAKALKIAYDGPDIPRFIMTTTGPFVVEDLANSELRTAQVDSQIAGLKLAAQPPQEQATPGKPETSQQSEASAQKQEKPVTSQQVESGAEKQEKPATVKRAADASEVQTGMMIAFMLDAETAKQLVIPGGEPASNLHVTLAYLGDMEDDRTTDERSSYAYADRDPLPLTRILTSFALDTAPLSGVVGGLGRFFPAETEETPIIAMVDVPGLTEFRTSLVNALKSANYYLADNHGYTPHITLAYVDVDAPMPLEEIASLPLNFDTVTLCVGDERTAFKLLGAPDAPIPSPMQGVKRAAGEEESFMRHDLRKWRDMAVSRMASGKPLRPFVSEHIPSSVFCSVERGLGECSTVDEVKAVFTRATQWRQPPPEQLACEHQLTTMLKTLVHSGTRSGNILSYDAIDRMAFAQQIAPSLEQARILGHGFAQHQLAQLERGIGSGILGGAASLLSKAANLVERALSWAMSLFSEQVDSLPEDASEDDIDALLGDIATRVADTLAPTAIQTEVEAQVMDALIAANIAMIECINEPGACSMCVDNASAGPIPIGSEFPSGGSQAPFHDRCCCHVQAVA